MQDLDLHPISFDTAVIGGSYRPVPLCNIIEDETNWRTLPGVSQINSSDSRVTVTRWRANEQRMQEYVADTPCNCHVIKIVLRSMNVQLSLNGQTVQDGVAAPGMLHVTESSVPVRCLFRGPYDALHLYVPNTLVEECTPVSPASKFFSNAKPVNDSTVERLAWALIQADQLGGIFGPLYADSISKAIVARVLATARQDSTLRHSPATKLAPWRLRRAIDYLEAHLSESVKLADMAAAAGLTRMHFAAQFRAATSLRPHEYLLRRRIERAQVMLAGTDHPVVDVALTVGFQTQAHFTSVFKRFAGCPPHAWRQSSANRAALPHGGLQPRDHPLSPIESTFTGHG